MAYINVKGIGRVYEMEPEDRVLRSGAVERPDGTIVAGKTADPRRAAQWRADKMIERKKKAKAKAKTKAGR